MKFAFAGTYNEFFAPPSGSEGIYSFSVDAEGRLTQVSTEGSCFNPSYVLPDETTKCLYAVSEQIDSAVVHAFAIDSATGVLTPLNQLSTGGEAACHLATDEESRYLFVSHFKSATLTVIALASDGSLGAIVNSYEHRDDTRTLRDGPHTHETVFSPEGRYAYVVDLGLDRIKIYRVDKQAGGIVPNDLAEVAVADGEGPRGIVFGASGRFAYVIAELQNDVIVYGYDEATGALSLIETVSSLPDGFTEPSRASEVEISHDGRFLYASNRGADTIAIFSIDSSTGRLTKLAAAPSNGKGPRGYAIDPGGTTIGISNEVSSNVVVCALDPATGLIGDVLQELAVPQPTCFRYYES